MRKILFILLGLALLIASYLIFNSFIENKKKPKTKVTKIVASIYTETIVNKEIPLIITANGILEATTKIALFSEVQGVLKTTRKSFKPGTNYRKGEVIIQINSDDFYTSLQSQKSNFYAKLVSIIPDIKLDFPDQFEKWNGYLSNFNLENKLAPLPSAASDKEKFFISGRGINTSYYSIKNLEVKLAKYTIIAPFTGVLTEATVTNGSLIRPGQKLGEFINLDQYELAVSINSNHVNFLKIGKTVTLHNAERTKTYAGVVTRINSKLNTNSQTLIAFINLKDPFLKEGMFLEADIQAKSESNAVRIARNLLVNENQVYTIVDNKLQLTTVSPVFYSDTSVVLKGLKNGAVILAKPVPGAYQGMLVKVIKNETIQYNH